MKVLRSIKIFVALILTLTCIAIAPIQTVAAADEGNYVSEVYVAYGKNVDEAKKALADKGFTPVEGNLNDGGKTYAMLGYKTTGDPQKAITDLSVMNMNGGYSATDYKHLLTQQKTNIANFLNEFMPAIKEYRANLKAGKTRAVFVRDMLNKYTEDDSGKKLGDLLNSETLQDKLGVTESVNAENPDKLPDLITLLMQGNTAVLNSVEKLLAVSADSSNGTFLDRFASKSYDDLLDELEKNRPELNTETKRKQQLDNEYEDIVLGFSEAVANLRKDLVAYENGKLKLDTASEEELKKEFASTNSDEDAAKLETQMNINKFAETGSLYIALKEYEGGRFKKGELLDFFKSDEIDAEDLYPMAAALSDGQKAGLSFVSLPELIRYSLLDDEAWKKELDHSKSKLSEMEGMSVYDGVDRNVFKDDGSVALTDAAKRTENLKSLEEKEESKWSAMATASVISWACTAVSLASFVGFSKLAAYFDESKGFPHYVRTEKILLPESEWKYIRLSRGEESIDMVKKYEFKTIVTEDPGAVYTKYIANFFKFATIVLAVASAVMTVIALLKTDDTEQLPIPEYIVDNKSNGSEPDLVNYKAVQCNREEYFGKDYKKQKGSCADLLCDEGKQWLALYASTDKSSGNPVTTEIVVQKSKDAPQGFENEVSIIGELGAVNLASKAFRDYSALSQIWQNVTSDYSTYVFYKTDNTVLPAGEPAEDGNTAKNAKAQTADGGTAQPFNPVTAVAFGCIGLVLGAAVTAVVAVLITKSKKKKETAN